MGSPLSIVCPPPYLTQLKYGEDSRVPLTWLRRDTTALKFQQYNFDHDEIAHSRSMLKQWDESRFRSLSRL